ncbi:hypothetical protein SCLCIDRAFT_1006255 [Scleroderma citrinum Foug A]|uniref:Heterokaryon incompatibility domain-containing protein n=1 Tax=Scleroderma citrinum Foug A TaxID=1036808 RepID=A0A0C3AT71_9AGAM|nr:hypothetical protein SCLCIDRAFT_1006255 [Scleroderma citrinum Foug A]
MPKPFGLKPHVRSSFPYYHHQLSALAYKDANQPKRTSLIASPQHVLSLIHFEEVGYHLQLMITVEIDVHSCSMRLIDVRAFLEREGLMREGKRVNRRAKVLEFCDDEVTEYAILSHRWIEQEVDYREIVKLAKMDEEERTEIRQRDGYRKILQGCEQAKKDGFKWLWVDTCCIDKRSSAELSEAINSMYRWYENSGICYAYLHDVPRSSFPTARNDERYPKSNGWPEWFSRGWTLQEMIAPWGVQFFNKDWHPIGDKRTLSPILEDITRVPQYILKEGLSSDRPCVAQIMSWAANRTTTRVEDRAYSLMGLLDVHMPMLYGEGKKAFHRLQLAIIRTSNDQSIFAWDCNAINVRTGSILADDPNFFRDCGKMELMNRDEFIESLKGDIPKAELPSTEDGRLGTFLITNRGIQIWLFLCPVSSSDSVFQTRLPCGSRPSGPPVAINLALWESNYYRFTGSVHKGGRLHLRQVYLRYQDTLHCNSTFEIDDSAILKEGFTPLETWPHGLITGNTVTLGTTDPLCAKGYSCRQGYPFSVGFGQCFGQNWINVVCKEGARSLYVWHSYDAMLDRGPEYAQSMKAGFGAAHRQVYISRSRLLRSSWILQTSCVMWKSSRTCGVKLEVFQDPSFGFMSGEWTSFNIDTIPTVTGGVS